MWFVTGAMSTASVRIEREAMIGPMASIVSALSNVVAKGHQAIHFVSSTPSYHAVRRVFPQYGWKPASSLRALPQPFPAAFDAEPTFHSVLALGAEVSVRGCTHRPLAQCGLSCHGVIHSPRILDAQLGRHAGVQKDAQTTVNSANDPSYWLNRFDSTSALYVVVSSKEVLPAGGRLAADGLQRRAIGVGDDWAS